MKRVFILAIIIAMASFPAIAQSIKKTIHVTVKDGTTGRTIEGAEVTYKGFIGKAASKTTDAAGQATLEIPLLSRMAKGTITVKTGLLEGHKTFQTEITLTDNQDFYEVPVTLVTDYKKITVKVNSEAGPIDNAKVILVGARDTRDEVGYTNGYGITDLQVLLLGNTKTISVVIQKGGYKTYKGNVNINYKVHQYTIDALLEKDPTVKLLRVSVVANDDNSAIPEASVVAEGPTLNDYYTGSSNQSGVADVSIATGGDYTIKITHSKFKPVEQKININRYSSEMEFPMSVRMERIKSLIENVDVIISVHEEVGAGNFRPIPSADVKINSTTHTSDADGKVKLQKVYAMGNMLNITVSKKDYETLSRTITIENAERYTTKTEFEYPFTLKSKPEDVKIIVQVLDEKNNLPVGNASVTLKTIAGQQLASFAPTDHKGETVYYLKENEVVNASLRVTASASAYEERWSDIPSTMLRTGETNMYTIFLKNKQARPGEKMYGPFVVTVGSWHSTGLSLKKGQSIRVEASGILRYNVPPHIVNTPDGGGYWGWFVLKGKIGEQQISLGSKGSGSANNDGPLELGAPAVARMGHGDEKILEGHYTVYIFSRDPIVQGTIPAGNTQLTEKQKKAKGHLDYLYRLSRKEVIPGRTGDEIMGEIYYMMAEYRFKSMDPDPGQIACLEMIRKVLIAYYEKTRPAEADVKMYNDCLNRMMEELKSKMALN